MLIFRGSSLLEAGGKFYNSLTKMVSNVIQKEGVAPLLIKKNRRRRNVQRLPFPMTHFRGVWGEGPRLGTWGGSPMRGARGRAPGRGGGAAAPQPGGTGAEKPPTNPNQTKEQALRSKPTGHDEPRGGERSEPRGGQGGAQRRRSASPARAARRGQRRRSRSRPRR